MSADSGLIFVYLVKESERRGSGLFCLPMFPQRERQRTIQPRWKNKVKSLFAKDDPVQEP
jgi:hypothetical protein